MADTEQSVGYCLSSGSGRKTGSNNGGAEARLLDPRRPDVSLPMRAGSIPFRELVDLYMQHYAGRDSSRVQRLQWWTDRLGTVHLQDLSDDEIHAALEELASSPAKVYMGRDVDGQAIYKSRGRPMAPATVNRYAATIGAVLTWAIKRRIAPRGYVHPCRTIERRTENNERTRFLSESERARLLQACKASSWDRLLLKIVQN